MRHETAGAFFSLWTRLGVRQGKSSCLCLLEVGYDEVDEGS